MLLNSADPITRQVKALGINSWDDLIQFIKALPYGRNANRSDLSLVISEKKGTCSSKHAFLKKIADLNTIPNVQLILSIYKMNASNTPRIGNVLKENNIDFIPEAHCYLKINDQRMDITSSKSTFHKIEKDVLLEKEIAPEQVNEFKVEFHQEFLKKWIPGSANSSCSFDRIWEIREQCIRNMTE